MVAFLVVHLMVNHHFEARSAYPLAMETANLIVKLKRVGAFHRCLPKYGKVRTDLQIWHTAVTTRCARSMLTS